MPELPEVETLKRQLQRTIVGKKISQVIVLREKSFQGNPKEIIGKKIIEVERRAKILIIKLTGNLHPATYNYLIIHLKLTGQLIYQSKANKHTRVIIEFSDKSRLYFNDLRVFGWIRIIKTKNEKQKMKNNFGPEPFSQEFSAGYLKNIFSKTARAIKLVLLDQQLISGIGNIYSSEALWKAGIRPTKQARKLSNLEIKKLREAIIMVLEKGIESGGASDNTYRQLNGMSGQYQKHFLVYERDGKKCRKCQNIIKRIKIGGRGTFYCPKCQR